MEGGAEGALRVSLWNSLLEIINVQRMIGDEDFTQWGGIA